MVKKRYTRKFNGHTYYLHTWQTYKNIAQKIANFLRENRYKARVVKIGKRWCVYKRHKAQR